MKFLRTIGLVAAITVQMAGTAARAETPENTLVIATIMDDAITFDPAESYETTPWEVILNTYQTLVRYEPEDLSVLSGDAAESWTVSEDGRVFTFKLRSGLVFASGNALTAADVAYSFARVVKADKTPAFLLTQFGWDAENVDSMVVAVDDLTFQMTIGVDFAPSLVLNVLTTNPASIVDSKVIIAAEVDGDLGLGALKEVSAGSGAYVLKTWKPNEAIILESNPAYFKGAPEMARVILRHVPEAASQRLLLEKGDIDIARNLPGDAITAIEGNADLAILRAPTGRNLYIGLSQTVEPFTNPKVREAMKLLVDYQGMTDSFLKGGYTILQSYWPEGYYAAVGETPYSHDPVRAKALLVEAGYPDGFSFKLHVRNTSPAIDIAQAVQQNFAEAGIVMEIIQTDQKQFITAYRDRQFEAALGTWEPDFPDPHANTATFVRNIDNGPDSPAKTVAWRNSWKNDDLTALAEAAVTERDEATRIALYKDLQRRVMAEGPYIGMVQAIAQIAMRANVEGYVTGAGNTYFRLVTK